MLLSVAFWLTICLLTFRTETFYRSLQLLNGIYNIKTASLTACTVSSGPETTNGYGTLRAASTLD